MDIIKDVMIYQTHMMRNSSLGPYVPADFSPPDYLVLVNALFYASLGLMILAAFIAMLIKGWVREFDRDLRALSVPEQRAKTREFRYLGLVHWKLPEMVAMVTLLIQISLLLFSIGLVFFLFHISKPSFGITVTIIGLGVSFYVITTAISIFITSSPFRSPVSRAMSAVYRKIHAYLCPEINVFLSKAMDAVPKTSLARFRREILLFLRQSCPYSEGDFEKAIEEMTLDSVNLNVGTSALARIHNKAPDSQHSEALQWSVWRVAGAPTIRISPLLNMPGWIKDRYQDSEYLSRYSSASLCALAAVILRTGGPIHGSSNAEGIFARLVDSTEPWHIAVGTIYPLWLRVRSVKWNGPLTTEELSSLIPMNGLRAGEYVWVLDMLSEQCTLLEQTDAHGILEICLEIISARALGWVKWPPVPVDAILADAVVTLAVITLSPDLVSRQRIFAENRRHPWMLSSLRGPALISRVIEDPSSEYRTQLIRLLFLLFFYLLRRGSVVLAIEYFEILTSNSDFPLCTSALAATAPVIRYVEVFFIAKLLLAPQERRSDLILSYSRFYPEDSFRGVFDAFDNHLGAGEVPDPILLATLLVFSKEVPNWIRTVDWYDPNGLENPWLSLAARAIAQHEILDGSRIIMESFYDQRVCNMIAARFLLRYIERTVLEYGESLLLASMLQSQEFSITATALKNYIWAILSHHEPPTTPQYLPNAVQIVFNPALPDHQILCGWEIMDILIRGWDQLPLDWRQAFAKAFLVCSRRLLPEIRGATQKQELEAIITLGYFHEQENQSRYTDTAHSGLDWMAVAWQLHLSQRDGQETDEPVHTEENFYQAGINAQDVLSALYNLLTAAPHLQIIPLITQICDFLELFDAPDLFEYHSAIFAHLNEVIRSRHHFSCTLHI